MYGDMPPNNGRLWRGGFRNGYGGNWSVDNDTYIIVTNAALLRATLAMFNGIGTDVRTGGGEPLIPVSEYVNMRETLQRWLARHDGYIAAQVESSGGDAIR